MVVDQHAAHERLTFEEMQRGLAQGPLPRQGLLTPAMLELETREAHWAEAQAPAWARLGLELSHFGGRTWAVTAVPPILAGRDPAPVVRDLLGELADADVADDTPQWLEAALASLACRASIKQGQRLGAAELEQLVRRAAELPPPVTCPHGRPVFLSLSRRELAKHFKRGLEPLGDA